MLMGKNMAGRVIVEAVAVWRWIAGGRAAGGGAGGVGALRESRRRSYYTQGRDNGGDKRKFGLVHGISPVSVTDRKMSPMQTMFNAIFLTTPFMRSE
jgi:hypothetical protein